MLATNRSALEAVKIRVERPADTAEIRLLNKRAFGQDQEGNIVDALRANGGILLSLVAVLEGRIVGHIAYSPAVIGERIAGAALGPMAVLPEFQNRGIGSKLVRTGNQKIKECGVSFIIVVGHSEYYPRFGFAPAKGHGVKSEWDLPDDVFMLLVLNESRMRGVSGLAKYRSEFSTVE